MKKQKMKNTVFPLDLLYPEKDAKRYLGACEISSDIIYELLVSQYMDNPNKPSLSFLDKVIQYGIKNDFLKKHGVKLILK